MRSIIRHLLVVSGITLSFASSGTFAQTSSDAIAPSYAPGISGRVSIGPVVGPCLVATPCTQPFAKVAVQMLDKSSGKLIGQAISNGSGGFIATVPAGSYIVHVVVPTTTIYPRCPDTGVVVSSTTFTYVSIVCDSGIRT